MDDTTRPAKGWWTMIGALAVVVVGQLQTWDWVNLVHDPVSAGWVITGLGVGMAALRYITTGPVGTKE